ncbi:uncharacterized protein LOC126744291 isoform X2 [Anthonomus grandis grandis]|uniref:uncharacterized protein LOC126744291 isoform X2 n=1 Tax=Anthonomus grandis grandis TaxID=2921223 RepID=UPI002165872D|nr:uncharacterized protein LOC126744291 isoform X2 [Anthonomus grandis grandis]
MQAKVSPLPNTGYGEVADEIRGDSGSITILSGGTLSPSASEGGVLQRQWVTLTAEMWPPASYPEGSTAPLAPPSGRLPLLAAVFCGAALVVALLGAFILYWCCVMPRKENKHYCLRKVDPNMSNTSTQVPSVHQPAAAYPVSQAAVFAEQKRCGWGYSNRLIAGGGPLQPNPWYTSRVIGGPQCTQCPGICPVPRSSSTPGNHHQAQPSSSRRQRPVSQPIPSNINIHEDMASRHHLPEISEFSPQYASSSILDEVGSKDSEIPDSEEPTLKTRSLPAWVRSKPRPLSTEDDLNDLYAKVNFSKKRKNRMRNDEAAIIALSKSRSQFLHKDTDSLVDNEAVIVYDERTAL